MTVKLIPHQSALDRLMGDDPPASGVIEIALDLIHPNQDQPRQHTSEDGFEGLKESVELYGILQPIGVRPMNDTYVVIFGERRYHAAAAAGLTTIPAIVYDVDPDTAIIMTAIENLQREDLDLEDEARQFLALKEAMHLTSDRELAKRLGVDHSYISRRLRLLRERPEYFALVRTGQVSATHALLIANPEVHEQPVPARTMDDYRLTPNNAAIKVMLTMIKRLNAVDVNEIAILDEKQRNEVSRYVGDTMATLKEWQRALDASVAHVADEDAE